MVGKCAYKTDDKDGEYCKFLKLNNKTLAKALNEERLINKQYLDERNMLQKKLQTSMMLNVRYEALFKQLLTQSKHTLPNCIALSDTIAQMIKLCSDGTNLSKTIDNDDKNKSKLSSLVSRPASPVVPHKTHAVKPMVGGHVIFRPTINLWRLSETEHNEITRNIAESQSSSTNTAVPVPNSNTTSHTSEGTFINDSNSIQYASTRQPVRGYIPEDYEDDDDTDEEFGSSEPHENNHVILESRSEGLDSVPEGNEESLIDSRDTTNLCLKEARIVIHPLPSQFRNQEPKNCGHDMSTSTSDKSVNYDPLEGPSNLLDEGGNYTRVRNVPKRRAAALHRKLSSDSDSNTDNESTDSYEPGISQKSKKRRTKKSKTCNKQPVVVLTQLSHELTLKQEPHENSVSELLDEKRTNKSNLKRLKTNKKDLFDHISPVSSFSELRPRRNVSRGSMKEVSLKCKLRRTK